MYDTTYEERLRVNAEERRKRVAAESAEFKERLLLKDPTGVQGSSAEAGVAREKAKSLAKTLDEVYAKRFRKHPEVLAAWRKAVWGADALGGLGMLSLDALMMVTHAEFQKWDGIHTVRGLKAALKELAGEEDFTEWVVWCGGVGLLEGENLPPGGVKGGEERGCAGSVREARRLRDKLRNTEGGDTWTITRSTGTWGPNPGALALRWVHVIVPDARKPARGG